MIVLVSGGAGFIGSYLCEFLIKHGHEVYCLDNLSTGHKSNIRLLLSNRRFHFIRADVTLPRSFKVKAIFHMASPASPLQYIQRSIPTMLTNSLGTYYLLELARKTGARFLFASTSEVYGEPLQHPQKESYWGNVNPIGVRSCYDESKRFGEAMTMEYYRKYGVDARVIRIFNTYGPRLDSADGRVVSNFIVQALNRQPLTIYGKGTQTRSFCYVSDMVVGIYRAMFFPKTKGEVINLGSPTEITISQCASLVQQILGLPHSMIHKPLLRDDPTRRKPDIRKAKKLLKWQPVVSMKAGLKVTIEWFRGIEPTKERR